MVRLASGGDVGLNAPLFHLRDVVGAEEAVVEGPSLGPAQRLGNGIQGGDGLTIVVWMVGQGVGHDQEAILVHCCLGIVVLVDALGGAALHDARLGIGEVVLIAIARAGLRGLRRSATWLAALFLGLPFSLAHFGFVLGLFELIALLGARLQHSLGLPETG